MKLERWWGDFSRTNLSHSTTADNCPVLQRGGLGRNNGDRALAQTVRVKTLLFCPLNPGLKARVIDVCFPDDMKP